MFCFALSEPSVTPSRPISLSLCEGVVYCDRLAGVGARSFQTAIVGSIHMQGSFVGLAGHIYSAQRDGHVSVDLSVQRMMLPFWRRSYVDNTVLPWRASTRFRKAFGGNPDPLSKEIHLLESVQSELLFTSSGVYGGELQMIYTSKFLVSYYDSRLSRMWSILVPRSGAKTPRLVSAL
ncbi:hypothetical protein EDD17DRAFT_1560014 [Pisolithus thermaeus]|nr:hypothetical protein EDD17DRAFT_1560014 [Pisolithus thermaeus]